MGSASFIALMAVLWAGLGLFVWTIVLPYFAWRQSTPADRQWDEGL